MSRREGKDDWSEFRGKTGLFAYFVGSNSIEQPVSFHGDGLDTVSIDAMFIAFTK